MFFAFRCRHVFVYLFIISIPVFAKGPSGVDKYMMPSAKLPADVKSVPLDLLTSGGQTITAGDWPGQREKIRKEWRQILGPLPKQPEAGLKYTVVSDESLTTCSRIIIQYEVEPGRTVIGCILRPVGDPSIVRPGIVAFHPTHKDTYKVVAGLGGRPDQHIGLSLVDKGFIVFCPANYIFEKESWLKSTEAARNRHPLSTGMATMLADGLGAVDILLKQPGVDPSRIGAIGHSLGAKEVLYLMAFDDRIKVGVSSEGGVGIRFSNWDDAWYLGPQIERPGFQHDHHELIAMIAPRPYLVLGGETGRAADGDRTWPYIQFGNQVNEMLGKPASFGLINHRMDHMFLPPNTDKAFEWLTHYLNPPGS